jgi:hypothetical protein
MSRLLVSSYRYIFTSDSISGSDSIRWKNPSLSFGRVFSTAFLDSASIVHHSIRVGAFPKFDLHRVTTYRVSPFVMSCLLVSLQPPPHLIGGEGGARMMLCAREERPEVHDQVAVSHPLFDETPTTIDFKIDRKSVLVVLVQIA